MLSSSSCVSLFFTSLAFCSTSPSSCLFSICQPWTIIDNIYPFDMVRLVTTSRILSALEDVPPSSRQELDLPDTLSLEAPIAHEQLIRLARYFRTRNDTPLSHDDRSLNSLLRGTKVYVPPPPPKPEPVRHHHPLHQLATYVVGTSFFTSSHLSLC